MQTTYLGRATHLKPPKTTSEPLTALLHLRSADHCSASWSSDPVFTRKFFLSRNIPDYPDLSRTLSATVAEISRNKADYPGLSRTLVKNRQHPIPQLLTHDPQRVLCQRSNRLPNSGQGDDPSTLEINMQEKTFKMRFSFLVTRKFGRVTGVFGTNPGAELSRCRKVMDCATPRVLSHQWDFQN